jgi:hypothetical protein
VEALVARHAGEAAVQALPGAAALLASTSAAKTGDGRLTNLKNWATAPLLQVHCCHATIGCADDNNCKDTVLPRAIPALTLAA